MRAKKTPEAHESVRRFCPDEHCGLTQEEVAARRAAGLYNVDVKAEEKTVLQVILSNLFTYFNLLFFFLALCLVFTGSGVQNLMFLGVVFCNTVIGTVQELRAKKMLDRLNLVSSPRVTVRREGEERSILTQELVADDILLLKAGNQIPADGTLLSGELTVNESLVTGEADEIVKRAGDAALSGSFVISGEGTVHLTHVGRESFVNRLTLEARRYKKVKKPGMMRSLSLLVRAIGILVLPLGGVLFWQQFARRDTPLTFAMQSTVSNVIGMIPEGLYLLASTALALAVIRLGRRGILSHNLGCVEALARVDVLCVDKTGTITEDCMTYTGILPLQNGPGEEETLAALSRFAAATDADNATALALKSAFAADEPLSRVSCIPFSSRYKFSGVDLGRGEAYLFGAPEVLLGKSFSEEEIRPFLEKGERVLVFCACDALTGGVVQGEIRPLCFVTFANRIRESARETFRYFAKQGVKIKVISGDNPASVSAVARAAGIDGAEAFVDMSGIKSEKELFEAARTYTVFGRVTPEQKRALIRALKKQGHTVAMTGDGVNDVLALKEADCSVAMASGSEASANVSQIVLLNNDFSAMPSVVEEGRQVINNIQRSAALYLVKNIFSFCTAILLLLLPLTYPLQPVQLSLVSLITIGIPSFFLALEKNHERVQGSFLKNVITRALPAGLTDFVLVAGVMLFCLAFPTIPDAVAGTVVVALLCLVGFLMLYDLSKPFNRFRKLLFGALLLLFFALTLLFPNVFMLTSPTLAGWLLIAVFSVVACVLFAFFNKMQHRLSEFVNAASDLIEKKGLSSLFSRKRNK